MGFEVPEHVRPIRDRVRRFVETRVRPAETLLDDRNDEEAQRAFDLYVRARESARGLRLHAGREAAGADDDLRHGGPGVTPDTPLERRYRHPRLARIYDGPGEVHRVTVARRTLRAYLAGEGWELGLRSEAASKESDGDRAAPDHTPAERYRCVEEKNGGNRPRRPIVRSSERYRCDPRQRAIPPPGRACGPAPAGIPSSVRETREGPWRSVPRCCATSAARR